VILEDCTMASTEKIHEQTLDTYRKNALYPLLRVATSTDFIAELDALE
jgi:hypothetical protein